MSTYPGMHYIQLCSSLVCCLILLFAPLPAQAAPPAPYLVQDINQVATADGSTPEELINLNGVLLFTAYEGVHGTELWRSDGTEAGTQLVKDIAPGYQDSYVEMVTVFHNEIYFSADDGNHGPELWKSNGTEAGTTLVADLRAGAIGAYPFALTVAGNTLFFIASTDEAGSELWKSNGTADGTMMVKELMPGPDSANITILGATASTLFFAARTENGEQALWKSDGTATGTLLVKTFPTGSSIRFDRATVNGNTLYVVIDDTIHGGELWKSDGTAAGTQLVKDIYPGTSSADPSSFYSVGNLLFFVADDGISGDEVWRSDGTAAGTVLVKDIARGAVSAIPYWPEMAVVDGTLFFSADDGHNGRELWRSDGSAAGTTMVKNINPGANASSPGSLQAVGNLLYFASNNGTTGRELWRSDGTANGTVLIKDIQPGERHSSIDWPAAVNGKLFFSADDGKTGPELWISNGTANGTYRVKDLTGAGDGAVYDSELIALGNTLFFSATDGKRGVELWRSDGTADGTIMVKDIWRNAASAMPRGMVRINNTLFFSAEDARTGHELWRSDGTATGTRLVKDIATGHDNGIALSGNGGRIAVNNQLFFQGYDPTHGIELWVSDGTANGTRLVKDLWPGPDSSYIRSLIAIGNTLYFSAYDGTITGLWKSDGTTAGTQLIRDHFSDGLPAYMNEFTVLGNTLYFSVHYADQGSELWKSDGTAVGTVRVMGNYQAGVRSYYHATAVGEMLFLFSQSIDTHNLELWKSDGTDAGTVRVKTVATANTDLDGYEPVTDGQTLFFSLYNHDNGAVHLWRSDGAEASTVPIATAHAYTLIRELTVASGMLYFIADDGMHGIELWQSDGASATATLFDIFPGIPSSHPTSLTATGNRLYFMARGDLATGRELWALPLAPTEDKTILLSTTNNGQVGALAYRDEDILTYHTATQQWELTFDGSDVGLGNVDVDAFAQLANGHILLSVDKDFNLATVGAVDDADILEFTPTSLGPTTMGSFTLYFDGSDVGLDTSGEDIDAIDFGVQERLRLSVAGAFNVAGLSADDEDLLRFQETSLGENTAGAFNLIFDGSDVALTTANEDVRDTWTAANDDIYFVTYGNFQVAGLSGDGNDIIICQPTSLGATTGCTFSRFWDGGAAGLGTNRIDGLHIVDTPATIMATGIAAAAPGDDTIYSAGDDAEESNELDGDEEVIEMSNHFYLPLITR